MRNWAGNRDIRARRVHRPRSVEELQEIVRATPKIRALGSRHTFNELPDAAEDGDLVSLEALPRRVEVSADRSTVTVDGAARYGDTFPGLDAAGVALANLASLPHIAVAGACATGTHGSGVSRQSLSAAVRGIDLVGPDGEVRRIGVGTADGGSLPVEGCVVALGALGVVTQLTLAVEPAHEMEQTVYEHLSHRAFGQHALEIAARGYSVSFFTTWRGEIDQVWVKSRVNRGTVDVPRDLFGASAATAPRHPIATMSADACTEQLGKPGRWHDRLPHFRLDHTPSSGDELQSEYLVDRRHLADAYFAVNAIRARVAPLALVSELRTVARDELWLSPAYGRDSAALHFTWRPDWKGVRAILPDIERALAPFDPRPHWGKLFTMPWSTVAARYPRHADFRALVGRLDPGGKFGNAFVEKVLEAREAS
jgi:alditol oxidase